MITEIRSGFNVKRYHTVDRTREETVGHHSAGVCAILLRLDPDCSRDILIHALMHDVAEVYTGDVPYPFKVDHPDIKTGLDEGETAYIVDHDIPEPEITPDEYKLFKLADMLDLVLSGIEELNRGNLYAKEYINRGQEYIEAMFTDEEKNMDHGMWDKVNQMVWEVKGER